MLVVLPLMLSESITHGRLTAIHFVIIRWLLHTINLLAARASRVDCYAELVRPTNGTIDLLYQKLLILRDRGTRE